MTMICLLCLMTRRRARKGVAKVAIFNIMIGDIVEFISGSMLVIDISLVLVFKGG